MMPGGHLNICVMGGMQVAANGDLANGSLAKPGEAPAVGGAMDLAVDVRRRPAARRLMPPNLPPLGYAAPLALPRITPTSCAVIPTTC